MITRWELFNVTQTFDFNFHQFEITGGVKYRLS